MTKQVQLRRGSTSEHLVFTGAVGELTIDTNLDVAVVHDGSTAGGHYLVGVAATQNIINKVSVGIGTSGTENELGVIGNVYVAGDIATRSINIIYEEPVTRTGIISNTPNNFITGIATNNIRVGYYVTNTTVSSAATVISIEVGSITISEFTSDSQISTSAYVATSNGNHLIDPYVGIDTSVLAVGYAVSGFGVLPNTTISSLSSFLNGSVFLSQNTTGTVGVITASGTVSSAGTIITGITTTNLVVGYSILFDPSSGTPNNTQIVSINVGQIVVDDTISVTGTRDFEFGPLNQYYFSNLSISTSFSFTDPISGKATIDVIEAQEESVVRLNVTNESNTDTARVNTGIITTGLIETAYITSGIITNTGLTTATIDQAYINVGIGTTVGISSARLDEAYITSGIATNLIAQYFNVDTSVASTSFFNVGIGTTVGISSLRSDNLYVNIGIATEIGIQTARVDDLFVGSGIATDFVIQNLSLTDLYVNSAYINSGIITTAGINTANINLANIDVGIATSFNIGTSSINLAYITSGISSTFNITDTYIGSANINSGIITAANIDTLYSSDTFFGVGIGTTASISEARIDTLYANSGILTSSRVGFSTLDVAFISTSYTNTGFATYFDVTGVGTVQRLESFVGFITYLNGSDINYSGLSTFGNVTIGIGNTDLIVSGDARVTGILSIGSGTVTINGTDSSVSGINSLRVASGFVTDISGTNLNYSGISTLNEVGVSTLSFVGVNTLLSNQNKSVTIELSNSGVATNYTLTLPAAKGSAGQILSLLPDGTLGFTTNGAGLFESRYYVSSQNGDDSYNGRSLPVKSIKRAAQLASFDSFVIPGQRYLDAGDLLEANKEFIQEEVVSYLEFNYENIATELPDYDPEICKRDVGYLVDALVYDIRFGGNSKSIEAGFAYWDIDENPDVSYLAGEEEQAIFAYEYIKFLGQYVINNQTPPTIYQTTVSQSFDFTVSTGVKEDPANSNTNYFHRSKDARNLIVGNRQEIIDKSLASVALAATTGFYFPGETETNERSRYYDSYKLIQINKQEILDKSIASIALGFPTGFYVPGNGITSTTNDSRYYDAYRLIQINKDEIVATALTAINIQYPTLWSSGVSSSKCQRDLGYFVDAVSTDIFTGGNNYVREFTGFYFVGVGTTSLAGEEQQTIYGFQQAGIEMRRAITNLLTNKNLGISSGPATYGGGGGNVSVSSTLACTDVQNTITSLVGVVTASIGAATTSGLPAVNYGDFDLNVIGFGTTAGIWKCARDTGFFIDAVSTDVFTGGNNYVRSFTGFYFTNVGNPLSNGLVGETAQSNYVFESARDYMRLAVTNQLNARDLTITADPATGFNTSPNSCANVRSTIGSLTGIVTTAIGSGSTAGIGTTTNYGYFLVNSTFNVSDFVGIGTTNVVGGRKCARDLGYIVDAIAQDVSYGTNQHIVYATKKYFNGAGTARTDGLLGEEAISAYAFQSVGKYAKQAVTNWLNYQDLSIVNDVSIGNTNKNPNVCANTRSTIDSLVGILTGAILSGSLSGITSVNLGLTDCADVRSALVNYVGIITTIVGFGTTAAPAKVLPQTQSKPVCIFVEAGEYIEDNPIILYDDVAIVGDNLRNTIIRPLNAGKDMFRVRNGVYVTGFALKDSIDEAGIPLSTWNYAVAFDDPLDTLTSRAGYATKVDKPIISRSPYIQNCSILSFLGANGILVDGNKVQTPNIPVVRQEAEIPLEGDQPEQGKSMVAAAFTMVSFGGIGWRTINDGYAQVVSCFQIFCRYGSLTQSGGYLSITNSATNFGFYALRSTGFSPNSFRFDRGRIAATGTSGGLTTLKVVGLGRSDQDLYVARIFNNANQDVTQNFKATPVTSEFVGTAVTAGGVVNITNDTINILSHPFSNGDSLVYLGDEGVIPNRIIGGLVNGNQYYVVYNDSNSFRLAEDDGLTRIVDLTSASTGIHTFQKNTFEFFAFSVLDRHNSYQKLTLAGVGSTANFVSGREITQTVVGGTAVGIAYTYNQTSRELVVSVELSEGVRRNFAVSNGTTILNITDHSGTPIGVAVTVIAGLTTYWSTNSKVDSTLPGQSIQGVQNLPETYKLHWHRPSIINSSSHTWEYSGSGIDYNALPQNGGKTDTRSEQVSERGGRVFSSGTNELGDFKIGDFITAFNRTGNIIFNNTVTIGTLDSLRLSLSGGVSIEEFSVDSGLGDNELGGPLNKRVPTQLATRSFLNNRLGGFIDKSVSTNAVPNAIVQLNAIGQINADLIPPKVSNFYRTPYNYGRLQLHNQIPALGLLNGDTVIEPTSPYVLTSDTYSQYIILNNNSVYNFQNGDIVYSVLNQGQVSGVVTNPPFIGINTITGITTNTGLTFAQVGYGTTGLVRGVALSLKSLSGGGGYSQAGIYTGVRFDTASGIGTGITGTITVSAAGTVQSVAINTGGRYFAVNDTLTLNDPTPIGGRSGGSNFTVQIASVETRLYVNLLNNAKFTPTTTLPDYIADRNAVAISTNVGTTTSFSFTGTGIDVGGNVDFSNDRITTTFLPFGDGDPVKYTTTGTPISPLIANEIYYVKKVGISSYTIHLNYGLATTIDLTSSGTGTHTFTRVGFRTETNQIVVVNHGFTQGDPVQINAAAGLGTLPTGLSTGFYYFVGSATTNSFTFHESRASALASINGLILDEISLGTNGSGIVSYTKQNISFTSVVNTSGQLPSNWSAVGGGDIDASNIITGVINTTRLAGSGSANNQTFLRGDSAWAKAVSSVGFGTTQPVQVSATSSDLAAGGVGVNTYYGNIEIKLNRTLPTLDAYSTIGVSQFKTSTFNVGSDGQIQIKTSSQGGDVDAATLGGNNSSYHLDVANHQGTVPIARGGTGLTGLPPSGSLLLGNGTAYTLTTTPTFTGTITTRDIAVQTGYDISFTTGTWTGEKAGKIQFSSNSLYLQFTTSLIGRNASGTDVFTLGNGGNATFTGVVQGTRFTSTITTGTAPLTVSSTTEVANLNAALLNGYASDTSNTANAIVRRDASNQIFAGRLELSSAGSTSTAQLTFSGTTNNWITFGTNGVAAPAFTTRSLGTKIVLYDSISGSAADYALGIDGSTLWSGVPTTSQQFRWYGGTTLAATLSGAGALTLVGGLSATTLTSTVATGTAPLTVASTTLVTNLNADLLDGLNSATAATANTIVARDASGNITGARVDATTHRATTFDITADTNNRLQQGALILRSGSPTIYLRDTDHNVSMIHCNSNIFYVLRGANDTETWTQVNGVWPLQIDLTNNNATFGGTVTASSDVRFKKNINTIQDALDKILNMRGVTFERLETPGTEIGVIAQEIEEVVPEVVTTDANGHKSVAYANITALLIEAVKTQQVQINELREEIKKLKGE
jgi:hypothetical protein